MFTQKISMDCTKEQYEKYLKEELLKMGYKEDDWSVSPMIIVNNAFGGNNFVGMYGIGCKNSYNRAYLGSFNAPLFLALAAMTDKATGGHREYYTNGTEFVCLPFTSICGYYSGIWRKATKDEIISLFGEKKCNHNTLENKIDQLNENGQVEVNISFDATELNKKNERITKKTADEISEIMSDLRYKIDQYHIAALKSKGYKILKPKTWEEV